MPSSSSATATSTSNGAATATATPAGSVAALLAELRELAEANPSLAQHQAWTLIKELGASRDEDKLEELFALGSPPRGLDGPTDGILVTPFIHAVADLPLRLLTRAWMPWQGKSFDAANARGINRMTRSTRLPAKLLWPRYGMHDAGAELEAFEFETAVEPGRIEPAVDVLKIDYEPVESNPRLVIRQIRDELVELVPDTYLGRILFRTRSGGFTNIGYFALRQPATGV